MKGRVYITSAGAGGADELTLKAHRVITQLCDVFVYDRLVSEEIIALIPHNAEKIFAGKFPDNHIKTQDEINQLLVDYAKKGHNVCRLKGGDAFIYGRGGEEIEFLKSNDISCEVVAGLSAHQVAAQNSMLPITYRGISDNVIIVSGHSQQGGSAAIDFSCLRDKNQTIVLYMAMNNISFIVDKLLERGFRRDLPVFVEMNSGGKESKKIITSLERVIKDIKISKLSNPAIIIIGDVVLKAEADC